MSANSRGIIAHFSQAHDFLSNFHPSPIVLHETEFPTAEHAFQAYKVDGAMPNAGEWVERIRSAPTPGEAKKLGRQAPLFDGWDIIRFTVMRTVVEAKFAQNPELATKLLETENAILIEGNTWHDQIWGDCGCDKHKGEPGLNALGTILMGVRLDHIAKAAGSAQE